MDPSPTEDSGRNAGGTPRGVGDAPTSAIRACGRHEGVLQRVQVAVVVGHGGEARESATTGTKRRLARSRRVAQVASSSALARRPARRPGC
ncbi:MAG: hypothetical protein ACRD03_00520, partial [Acidimicrobiales bacterium]